MKEQTIVESLAALAHIGRLQLFRKLIVAGPAGLTPGAMTLALGIPATSLSFHLKELVHSGLISQERDGRHLIYRAQFEHMADVLNFLTANCCAGVDCGLPVKAKLSKPNHKELS